MKGEQDATRVSRAMSAAMARVSRRIPSFQQYRWRRGRAYLPCAVWLGVCGGLNLGRVLAFASSIRPRKASLTA